MKLLLEAQALPSVPAAEDRVTPLHEAAARGEEAVVRLLLQHGAARGARDRQGRTPGDLAEVLISLLLCLHSAAPGLP